MISPSFDTSLTYFARKLGQRSACHRDVSFLNHFRDPPAQKLPANMAFFNVQIPNEVVDEFNNMKLRHTYQYILLKLTDDLKKVEICKKVDKMKTDDEASSRAAYESFAAELDPNDCCFAIFDFHYTEGESGIREKLIFMAW